MKAVCCCCCCCRRRRLKNLPIISLPFQPHPFHNTIHLNRVTCFQNRKSLFKSPLPPRPSIPPAMDPSSVDSALLLSLMKSKLESLDTLAGLNSSHLLKPHPSRPRPSRVTEPPVHTSKIAAENASLKAEVEELRTHSLSQHLLTATAFYLQSSFCRPLIPTITFCACRGGQKGRAYAPGPCQGAAGGTI